MLAGEGSVAAAVAQADAGREDVLVVPKRADRIHVAGARGQSWIPSVSPGDPRLVSDDAQDVVVTVEETAEFGLDRARHAADPPAVAVDRRAVVAGPSRVVVAVLAVVVTDHDRSIGRDSRPLPELIRELLLPAGKHTGEFDFVAPESLGQGWY